LNKKTLLIAASILAFLYILAFVITYFDGFIFYWDDYVWLAFSIVLIFVVANYTTSLVSLLGEIHQNNLKDIEEKN